MNNILIGFLLLWTIISGCGKYVADLTSLSCPGRDTVNSRYSKAPELEKLLEEFTRQGVPGVALAVWSNEGYWSAARGYAKIEDKTPMQVCHLQYLQSISKTYMAVCILKLFEQGRIGLDEPMTKYLPSKYHRYIADGDKVTIRMLLNHTSGVPEYNFAPAYVSCLLQHPAHYFVPEDYVRYIAGKKLQFAPGSKHVYTNTNYVLLALIADAVAGDHAKLISETIIRPLALTNTFYRNEPGYLKYPQLVNSYWDRYSDGILENASQLQRNNVQALVGDDGIVTTPGDAVKFLKALADGRLLSPSTMQQMKTWVNNKDGKPVYGLGLVFTNHDGIIGFGHSGGGIGGGCELYYFPEKNICYFIAINLGTVTESPLHGQLGNTLAKFYATLLK